MNNLKPNFTQIPNLVLDFYMSELSGSELKVLLYICRRTYGFQKQSDKVSISQIMNGIKNHDGEQLDLGTGLSNRAVITAVKKLIENELIVAEKGQNKTTKYNMNIGCEKSSLVKKVHSTSEKSSPQLVKKVHTQKKEKESIQKKEVEETSPIPLDGVKVLNFSDEDMRLAVLLDGKNRENNFISTDTNFEDWANTFRLMRERNNFSSKQIEFMIVWVHGGEWEGKVLPEHSFWSDKIRSAGSLRKGRDTIMSQIKKKWKIETGAVANSDKKTQEVVM